MGLMNEFYKLPRLYCGYSRKIAQSQDIVSLAEGQAHYLRNVLRRNAGDLVRIFDGCSGEFLAEITEISKKKCAVQITEQLRPQENFKGRTHLLFTPLAKNRMDFVIEKGVELGATDFHPIITARTEHRKIRMDRLQAQIIESAEQCERLWLPRVHDIKDMMSVLQGWNKTPCIQWGCERDHVQREPLGFCDDLDQAFLIGPVGGFSDEEIAILDKHACITPIHLGSSILRAETASMVCLTARMMASI